MSNELADRIVELEQRERVLVRASSLPAQQLAEVHLRNEQRLTKRIAELERREKECREVLDAIALKCLGIRPHSTYIPSTMADEISVKLDRIAELERQLVEEKSKADSYGNRLYRINLKLQPDKTARELVRVEDAADDIMRQLAEAKEDIEDAFLQGFAVPIAALIRDRDLPTVAMEIMSANGITISKDSPISEFDLRPILDAARKERG